MRILTVSQLVEHVEQRCADGLYLYRGQRQDKSLLPKIARETNPRDVLKIETNLFREFKRRSRPFLSSPPRNPWDWLALAQHTGLATRLLDWTDNPLAALWFSVRKEAESRKPGALWVFRVSGQDIIKSGTADDPRKGERTQVFQPRHIAKTIVAQGGWFTVHKYMSDEKSFIPLDNNKLYKSDLTKLTIEAQDFSPLRRALDQCGINAASLFPELSGLCEFLNWKEIGRP
jgi:hypothetical protein